MAHGGGGLVLFRLAGLLALEGLLLAFGLLPRLLHVGGALGFALATGLGDLFFGLAFAGLLFLALTSFLGGDTFLFCDALCIESSTL